MKDFRENMIEAGYGEFLTLASNRAIFLLSSKHKEIKDAIAEKVYYSLKTEMIRSKMDSEFILKAILAHENYLLMMKKYASEIDETTMEILLEDAKKALTT